MIKVNCTDDELFPYTIDLGDGNPQLFTGKELIELWNKMGKAINKSHKLTSSDVYESLDDIYK